MAVQSMWIRSNMLGSPAHCDRRLTEPELKVQRSLQKLSIPDWYLNKRSVSPKILTNASPIESRPPTWRNTVCKKKSTNNPTDACKVTRKDGKENNSPNAFPSGTYKIPRQGKSGETNQKPGPQASPRTKQKLDSAIPKVNLSANISRTFPKVSPSRKIQNINIVLPLPPKLELSKLSLYDDEDSPKEAKRSIILNKSPPKKNTRDNSDTTIDSSFATSTWKTPKKESSVGDLDTSLDISSVNGSFSTPKVKSNFKIPAVSTPGHLPAPFLSSTILNDTLESNRTGRNEDPRKSTRTRVNLEQRLQVPAKKSETTYLISSAPQKNPESEFPSPNTKFFNSKKKSTELENIVQSKQDTRSGKVREIIQELNQKCQSSFMKGTCVAPNSDTIVRKVVRALERGSVSKAQEILAERIKRGNEEDTESECCSESEVKSAVSSTSISLKDIDSSDSDQRSPTLKSDDDGFNYSTIRSEKNEKRREAEEDDSVYWIPVPRCKLPRTSSLLSMMSKLSSRPSPAISPIGNEGGNNWPSYQMGTWGSTFRKGDNKRLFRIDETTVMDSGYSDRSDRSGANSSTSMVDSTLYDENQNHSGTDPRAALFKRSSVNRRSFREPSTVV